MIMVVIMFIIVMSFTIITGMRMTSNVACNYFGNYCYSHLESTPLLKAMSKCSIPFWRRKKSPFVRGLQEPMCHQYRGDFTT